ncbi:MAG: ABC transporter substrate-binding protein [Chloroflexi bacterium AL-W]|nr:ABC transporter substrate-binding protein [Chloroflexi bacterium AL-N1]NOK71252.1 ABC transporter substrate-binding protein [Chloroflexi bacterium AL-N10]NOK76541.1 ABC transporter substrate-binding protein [Chloroflexi bacterium AL-N5]NOK83659.1 ABC transporter substrate-binding protein [Chloroflexi bacterium AL-W]NOK92220.1 ABC transporter substrate-binding protein [Chloroflexi bacterium AL-N15]
MQHKPIPRRVFLRLVACGAGSLVVACSNNRAGQNDTTTNTAQDTPAAQTTTENASISSTYQEAPMLTERVNAGQLPPVDERLPQEPVQIDVVDEIGQYGGEWRTAFLGMSDDIWINRTINYDGLVRWDTTFTKIIPNVAKQWEVNTDGSQYTFLLREDLKWSDGKPFTSADIIFWNEDVLNNAELSPDGPPNWLQVDGVPVEITAPDEYTVIFNFAGPNGLFLQRLAGSDGLEVVSIQAEYAKQWHNKYNPEVEQLTEEQGEASWTELFTSNVSSGQGSVRAHMQNPALPTLAGWTFVNSINDESPLIAERNPYYWKVDSENNQLPYLDRVIFEVVEDRDVIVLMALNGEIDMQHRGIGDPFNKPLFVENQTDGDYQLFEVIDANMNDVCIGFNLTHKDPMKRDIFNNKLFRQAMSVAIDRQAIIDTTEQGQGEPWQAAPRRESDFFDEEMAKQFTTYDLNQANTWLDEAGYRQGSDGIRSGPDDQPIRIQLATSSHNKGRLDIATLLLDYWRAVGIDITLLAEERDIFQDDRRNQNDFDVAIWSGDGGLTPLIDPRWYLPSSIESLFGVGWYIWSVDPQSDLAVEPPDEVKQQITLYREIEATADVDVQTAKMTEILQIAKTGFYAIGVSLPAMSFGVVKNNFYNVPMTMYNSSSFLNPGPTNPPQYFKKTET